jgi:bacterioferritin-associated ferredoxin
MYVCLCADKTKDEIVEAIENGNDTIELLMCELDVCTGCGSCRRLVEKILTATSQNLEINVIDLSS